MFELFSPAILALFFVVALGAGYVRGFSGFGFSAIVVASMSLVMDPFVIVTMAIIFELVTSLFQFKAVYPIMEKPVVAKLLIGAAIAMPIGVSLLVSLDVDLVRIVLSLFILGMCLVLLSGWSLKKKPGTMGQIGVGGISGFANSMAIGGLPVGLFLSAQNTKPSQFRANMIGYLFLLDLIGIVILYWHGRVTVAVLVSAAMILPAVLFGTYLGSRRFSNTPPANFKRLVILLLIALSVMGLAKSFL